MEERLLTLDEVAGYLRLSHMTIYRMIKRGELKGLKIGNQWQFPRETIENWLARSMASKEPMSTTFIMKARSSWLLEYRPVFYQFVQDIIATKPDFLVLIERRGAKLLVEWGQVPAEYEGRVYYYQAFDFMPEVNFSGKYIALLDESVQHGTTLHRARRNLENRNALVRTFAFIGPESFLSGDKELEEPEVQVCLRLSDTDFTKTSAAITEYLLTQGKTQDTDHFSLFLIIRGRKGSVEIKEFLNFLSTLGDIFFVPSPAEENGIITITLDRPNFFKFEVNRLPVELDWEDGVIKIRFYFNIQTNTCICVPIAMPKLRVNIDRYFHDKAKDGRLPISLTELEVQYAQLSEEQKAVLCYRDLLMNISVTLVEELIKRLKAKDSPFEVWLEEPVIDQSELQRSFGKNIGSKLSTQIVQHLSKVTRVKTGKPYQSTLFKEEMESMLTHLSIIHSAKRQLQALLDISPVTGLLVNEYNKLKEKVSDREERVTHGLTFLEICKRLEGQLTRLQISFALDLGLDRTMIAPVNFRKALGDGFWEFQRGYRAGEPSPGNPPQVGHGDSRALDPVIRRLRRDKFLVPFVIDRLMRYCPTQRNGVEPSLLFKVLACLRLDWITKKERKEREEYSFWEATPGEFGPLPEILSNIIEGGGNPYQLAQHKGSFFRYGQVEERSVAGKEVFKNRFTPIKDWGKIVLDYYSGDELSIIDRYVKFYSTIYNSLDFPDSQPAVDTLLTLSAYFSEESTYRYAHKNLSLWIARFGHFIDLCREKSVRNETGDLAKTIISCEQTALSACDKVSRYKNLDNIRKMLEQMIEHQADPVIMKIGKEVLGRVDTQSSLSTRLLTLKQMAELMKAVSTMVKYMFSRCQDFNIPEDMIDQKYKLGHYLAEAKDKGIGLVKSEYYTPFEIDGNTLEDFSALCMLIASIDALYQEINLSFRHNCPAPELPPEVDEYELLTSINSIEQWFRKYAIKEGIFMFTDLDKSSIEFSNLDPLEIAKVINWYDQPIRGIIGRFNGEVRKEEGDGKLIMFRDQNNAVIAAISILHTIRELLKDITLLPMGIGICKGLYLESGRARRNELGAKINWAKKLASLDPPNLYTTEDLLEAAKALNVRYEEHPMPENIIKAVGQKVFKIHWQLVTPREIIR